MTTIGVVFMASHPPERLKRIACVADQAGLAELWLWEDCFGYSGVASAAAALASTDRLRVATGLLPVPLRNVALTGMELATLHRMFPGRVLSGVGHGVQDWMGQAGARVESPVSLLREYVTALTSLLRGETVTTAGRYIRLDGVTLAWPPSPHPDLYVGAVGERTIQLSAELASGTILVAGTPPERIRQLREVMPAGHILSVNLAAGSVARNAQALAHAIGQYVEVGADRVILEPAPDDQDQEGFIRLVAAEVQPLISRTPPPVPGPTKSAAVYNGMVKRLALPAGYRPPAELAYGDIRARALSRADLHDDVRGINASIELIRRTRGGRWPTGPVTEEFNYIDLVWHECEFREGDSFAYAVYDAAGGYLGCCYLYPMGGRTPLTADRLEYDVDVSWWVTPDAYDRGYYSLLYVALQQWLADAFPFTRPYYSNREIPVPEDI